ncbi:MAG TPA: glycosyltransferase 87 family protein [Thermoanaerobaculia bacterium]|nr:glycosyltransferase 87 family protein [Thermoanaerobaculia bacterium]
MPLILLFAIFASTPGLTARHGVEFYAVCSFLAGVTWLALRAKPLRWPFPAILSVALAARLLFIGEPPHLSGDVYRYLWDGTVSATGASPYAAAPSDPALASLREPWHGRINHPEIPSIYPPHAQALFLTTGGSLPVWRILLLLIEIGGLVLLRRLVPPEDLLAYALFPPLLFEGIWNGHADLAAGFFLLVAFAATEARRAVVSGASLAIAAGIKLTPLVALVAMLRHSRGRPLFLLCFSLVLVLPAIPFALHGDLMPGLHDYAARWSFNSPLYEIALGAVAASGATTWLRGLWGVLKDSLPLERFSPSVYGLLYDEMVARGALALVLVIAIVIVVRASRSLASGIVRSIALLLLCSPAIHPWYWLVMMPVAFVAGELVVVMLGLFAGWSYLLYGGVSSWIVFLLCYALPVMLAIRMPRLTASDR